MLVLHAHLPYVRHPEHEYFLEELWFYEAVLETYIPLLEMLERLENDGVDYRITLSLSPTLLEMLSDPLLNQRLLRHMETLLELTEREMLRTRYDASFGPLARMYNRRLRCIMGLYENRYGRNIAGAFGALRSTGRLEIITTTATHAYLPNLAAYPNAVRAQVAVGLQSFKDHMGHSPAGIWLPECGYYPGLDAILTEAGLGFCFLESHGLLHARPRARYGVFRPVCCPSGIAAFGRDSATVQKVWCGRSGYPGDPDYREFYRDIGYDLPLDYIGPYVHPDGIRVQTGIKYYRITGRTEKKEPYESNRAVGRAGEHALDFIGHLKAQALEIRGKYGFAPLIVAPYDAELFGHWWFEGVLWLEFFLRGLAKEKAIRAVTPSEYLAENPGLQEVTPQLSSWGERGYGSTWTDRSNDWALARIYRACERMGALAKDAPARQVDGGRALNQALRELLLAQSSDWPFLLNRGAVAEYARKKLDGHLKNFGRLDEMITARRADEDLLRRIESSDCLFPGIDYRLYGSSLE